MSKMFALLFLAVVGTAAFAQNWVEVLDQEIAASTKVIRHNLNAAEAYYNKQDYAGARAMLLTGVLHPPHPIGSIGALSPLAGLTEYATLPLWTR